MPNTVTPVEGEVRETVGDVTSTTKLFPFAKAAAKSPKKPHQFRNASPLYVNPLPLPGIFCIHHTLKPVFAFAQPLPPHVVQSTVLTVPVLCGFQSSQSEST